MEQTGTFNPKKFYEILAGILSRKYGVKITVQEIKKAARKIRRTSHAEKTLSSGVYCCI